MKKRTWFVAAMSTVVALTVVILSVRKTGQDGFVVKDVQFEKTGNHVFFVKTSSEKVPAPQIKYVLDTKITAAYSGKTVLASKVVKAQITKAEFVAPGKTSIPIDSYWLDFSPPRSGENIVHLTIPVNKNKAPKPGSRLEAVISYSDDTSVLGQINVSSPIPNELLK